MKLTLFLLTVFDCCYFPVMNRIITDNVCQPWMDSHHFYSEYLIDLEVYDQNEDVLHILIPVQCQ